MTYPQQPPIAPTPIVPPSNEIDRADRDAKEISLIEAKVKQPGIGFPSAGDQRQLLIIRLNIGRSQANVNQSVREGLSRLGRLVAALNNGTKTIDMLNTSGNPEPVPFETFDFSITVGFGRGFFDLLGVAAEKRPAGIREMPDHSGLGDVTPYSLGQTDMILQIGSSDDFVNRWVLENALEPEETPDGTSEIPRDIVRALEGWATITDVHAGFQRTDGRNLQGFNDGVSNPNRLSPLFDSIVWTTPQEEPNSINQDGTYMVFQKIVHDLDQWRALDIDEQQEWVGRSKATGLLLGTLSDDADRELAERMHSTDAKIRKLAVDEWHTLFDPQSDPTKSFFGGATSNDPHVKDIAARCPAWSHVRKANPRGQDGTPPKIIFRRGYPFMESGMDHKTRSGLLFVSFRKDLDTFEFIKKHWFGNPSFPVPALRPFTSEETAKRRVGGRYTKADLQGIAADVAKRELIGLAAQGDLDAALAAADDLDRQDTGREGLAGPSENGVVPTGEFLAIMPLGGGYYFVPSIPNKDVSQIGQPYLS